MIRGDGLIGFSLRVLWVKGNRWRGTRCVWLDLVVDSTGDGNEDHANNEPLGFRTRSALGFGVDWAFAGDSKPLVAHGGGAVEREAIV
ncbi:hypothetical protein TIFTF001_028875 [Ficus carica]|uniref:Uncharacterized protein n=1 Tax=Ficus carica TaxID=3494 RepID=A0AA88DQR5_FICCA|nr:hypothetical protein TIFTF001_028875 [Ficus carica]